jgi:hypothetical protein
MERGTERAAADERIVAHALFSATKNMVGTRARARLRRTGTIRRKITADWELTIHQHTIRVLFRGVRVGWIFADRDLFDSHAIRQTFISALEQHHRAALLERS